MEHYMEPDPKFVKDIITAGGKSLKKCFQCATCSVMCPLSPDKKPFPRKEMIWAQWGLKEKLLSDPDIWLCHQCNDCSSYCPRGAKPGEVLGALRAVAIANYSFPSFIAKAFLNPVFLPLLFLVPIVLLGIYFSIFGFHIPEGEVVFSHFIPHEHVEIAGFIVGAYVAVAILIGLWRYWRAITSGTGKVVYVPLGDGKVEQTEGFWGALIPTLIDIIFHNKFKECGEANYRYFAHFGVFYGFILLGISTLGAVVYLLMGRELGLPVTDPVKIIGNIGAVLLLGGCTWLVYARIVKKDKFGFGSYFDWFFLGLLFLVGITGALTELARLAQSTAAYWLYMVHLVVVFALLVYAPYSKFAHLAYRAITMVYEKSGLREKA